MDKLKVLVLDIETAPLLVYSWGIKDQYISTDQIHTDWKILAWTAKWLGDPESRVIYRDLRNNPRGSDRKILKPLWKLLDEAQIVITQNGERFDSRKINARFMHHKMKPPAPYQHIDTYRLVKRVAAFTSNTLAYLTEKFCSRHTKLTHKKFSGWSLWIECLKGNNEAWDEMKAYNIEDVLSTEELYLNIRAWSPSSFPKVFDMTDAASQCGTCGYVGRMREGKIRKAKKHKYKQHSCPKCGSWQPGERVKGEVENE